MIMSIPFPSWANEKPGWIYAGWIARHNPHRSAGVTYESLVENAKKPDHGELREVDEYPEGATCWYQESPTQ
jgi:hypothetical protein